MESPPPSSEFDDQAFDPSRPFQGVVVCCTSIPANERVSYCQPFTNLETVLHSILMRFFILQTDLASKVSELGGRHKYDLTPEVTHLVVGAHDTQKYRHVAKSRPDIKPMAIGWVDAVRNLWVQDDPIDFRAIEKEWTFRAFETGGGALGDSGNIGLTSKLLCCLSGFEDRKPSSTSPRPHLQFFHLTCNRRGALQDY